MFSKYILIILILKFLKAYKPINSKGVYFLGVQTFFNVINFLIDIAGLDILLYRIAVLNILKYFSTYKTGLKTALNMMFKCFSNTHYKILGNIKP